MQSFFGSIIRNGSVLRRGGRNDDSYNFRGPVRSMDRRRHGIGGEVAAMTTFQGPLYWRGDDGYEPERVGRVFNGREPDRYPAANLKAVQEDHVIAGVRLAHQLRPEVCV